ncbi:MAG TPA: EamA/RhaT family transporter, partial [Dongiaceae bacterium]|nr:EamA/RhaT family transporter [Dongiaceae bacterium]
MTSGGIGRGVGFAVLSFALFSAADAAVKWLTVRYAVVEVTFLVAAFALLPVAWLVAKGGGLAALRPRRPLWVAVRALLLAADTLCVYYAFSRLPLAEAYVVVFTAPMLVTALSVPLLG